LVLQYNYILNKFIKENKMKKLYLFSMLFVALLYISKAWAGKRFECSIPLPRAIAKVAFDKKNECYPNPLNPSRDVLMCSLVIYHTNAGNVYTNLKAATLNSYIRPDTAPLHAPGINGRLEQINGNLIDGNYAFVGYNVINRRLPQSANEDNLMTAWSFAFFDPRDTADINQRFFTLENSCSITDYNMDRAPGPAERILNTLAANPLPNRTINNNFTNLYQFYTNPQLIQEAEARNELLNPSCLEKSYYYSMYAVVASICCIVGYQCATGTGSFGRN
jgi:hypothetical protein